MKTKLILILVWILFAIFNYAQKSKDPLSDLKWGKFENHLARSFAKNAHWLIYPEQILYGSTINNYFNIDDLVKWYTDYYPNLLLPYKKGNEFEKRRLLPEIKVKWEKMGKELLKYETLILTTQKTSFGDYDFNNKGFSIRQPIHFYDGLLLEQKNIKLNPKTDDILFPNFINVEENLAEQLINLDKKREIEQFLIVKPYKPYTGTFGYFLGCDVIYNVIVTKESRYVLNIVQNPKPIKVKDKDVFTLISFGVEFDIKFIGSEIGNNTVKLSFSIQSDKKTRFKCAHTNSFPPYGVAIEVPYIIDNNGKKYSSLKGFIGGKQTSFNDHINKLELNPNEEVILTAEFPISEETTNVKFVSPELSGWQMGWDWDGIKIK